MATTEKLTSTTAPLAANATYTSDVITPEGYTLPIEEVRGAVSANVAGALHIEHSNDGTAWIRTRTIAVAANVAQSFVEVAPLRYVRLVYVNGATTQASFTLQARALFR